LCNALPEKKLSRKEILENELMEIFYLISLGYDFNHRDAVKKVIKLLEECGIIRPEK
jgi:hypothetical protein